MYGSTNALRSGVVRIWSDHPNIANLHTNGEIKTLSMPADEIASYVKTAVIDYLDVLSPNMDPPLYVYYFPRTYPHGRTILDVMASGHPSIKYGEIYVDI